MVVVCGVNQVRWTVSPSSTRKLKHPLFLPFPVFSQQSYFCILSTAQGWGFCRRAVLCVWEANTLGALAWRVYYIIDLDIARNIWLWRFGQGTHPSLETHESAGNFGRVGVCAQGLTQARGSTYSQGRGSLWESTCPAHGGYDWRWRDAWFGWWCRIGNHGLSVWVAAAKRGQRAATSCTYGPERKKG